jgi:amino acid transporter
MQPKKALTLFDSTCLIVGIIIGAGIFQVAPDIARGTGTWYWFLAIWVAGGLLSLFGALGYAELASAYPQSGGDYIYLGRAYGRWAGFLFGWIQTAIVRPGDIVVMAFIFANYASAIYGPLGASSRMFYAIGAVALLTAINILGVREGKWTQNLLTSAKVLGLVAIVVVALLAPRGTAAPVEQAGGFPLSVALILVLFTFGGWNEMAYVAAEVRNPGKNIVRALVLGTVAVTVLYLLVNGAYMYTLGFDGLAASETVAADTVSALLPHFGDRLISILVCVSALGAVNGLILAGARISYAVGADHPVFSLLGRWNPRTGTPVAALLLQGGIAIILVLMLGNFIDTIMYTAASVYTFYLATNLAVIVLRRKEPAVERPYRVTGYPVTTLIFCAVCAFLIYSAITYKPQVAIASVVILLLGLPVYWWSNSMKKAR